MSKVRTAFDSFCTELMKYQSEIKSMRDYQKMTGKTKELKTLLTEFQEELKKAPGKVVYKKALKGKELSKQIKGFEGDKFLESLIKLFSTYLVEKAEGLAPEETDSKKDESTKQPEIPLSTALDKFCNELKKHKKAITNGHEFDSARRDKLKNVDCSALQTAFTNFRVAAEKETVLVDNKKQSAWIQIKEDIDAIKVEEPKDDTYVDKLINVSKEAVHDDKEFELDAQTLSRDKIGQLKETIGKHQKFYEILIKFKDLHLGFEGDIPHLYIGPLAFPLTRGTDEETTNQLGVLYKLFSSEDTSQIILGWCVGNKKHNRRGRLKTVLKNLKTAIPAKKITVHTAAEQAHFNPELIQNHFGRELLDPDKIQHIRTEREDDAVSYRHQAEMEKIGFDSMITDTRDTTDETDLKLEPTGKSANVKLFGESVDRIFSAMQNKEKLLGVRELLAKRTKLLRPYAEAHLTKNQYVDPEIKKKMTTNHEELVRELMERLTNFGMDNKICRRGELMLHSMTVLEGIVMECLRGKPEENNLDKLIPAVSAEDIFQKGFYFMLFNAVMDNLSKEYMGNQEYEFEKYSGKSAPIIYIYSNEVGPFLTEDAVKLVVSLIGAPESSITAETVENILSQ